MTDSHKAPLEDASRNRKGLRRRRWVTPLVLMGIFACITAAATLWLWSRANILEAELRAASSLLPQLENAVVQNNASVVASAVDELRTHTAEARSVANDPLWIMASAAPWFGPNFQAVSEVATSADDVASLGAAPLASVIHSLEWSSLMPAGGGVNVDALEEVQPELVSAAHAVRESSNRLDAIDTTHLLPQVSEPLISARNQLGALKSGLDVAASVSRVAPEMLGSERPRSYLLMIQNNAELRATGGISGALALLSVDKGQLSLSAQSSAGSLGTFTPPFSVDPEQQTIYSARLGKFMQDVNLTPDFPTAADTASEMWRQATGQPVDGVIAVDPVALGYLLKATGPVKISDPDLLALAEGKLPTELNARNVVPTLLSDVYKEIEETRLQDVYFAGVSKEVFGALTSKQVDPKALLDGLLRGTSERRVSLWSKSPHEQSIIAEYPLGGAISGPSVAPAQFGVYFNDGTGAKMDYYAKRTVQLIKECPKDGYEQTTVRVTSTSTAPVDAATSLPAYVTGDGVFGVPPGSVQTNIVVYGPVQAHVETVNLDGQRTEFAPYIHSNRPVGVLAIRLAPGERRTVDFTFGKIVQNTEPNVVVTPTVQDVKDVTLPTETVACG